MGAFCFEDLDCWQKSVALAEEVYQITNMGGFKRDFGLRDQIRRAVVSVASNIAEGKERQTVPEFVRFLYIAKGSVGELRTQLLIACRIGYLHQEKFSELDGAARHISSMIANLIKTLYRK